MSDFSNDEVEEDQAGDADKYNPEHPKQVAVKDADESDLWETAEVGERILEDGEEIL